MANLAPFLIQWGLTSLSLWVASYIFSGLRFADGGSLLIAALLLGFARRSMEESVLLISTEFQLPIQPMLMPLTA